ncbi:histidine phosphatase family protein [Kineococcus arenarius]|uniref:histidine phosphatase family protein n=1 Tax=unclassified Kineococcus TaxID=2621656 RepID=UPI003D7EEBDE
MARTLLYLARHGEQDQTASDADGGLSPLGREQADRLGRRLAAVTFSQVHHSPLARAVQTTDVLARHLLRVARHPCGLVADRTPVPSAARRDQYPERWLSWLDGVPAQERDEDAAALRGAVEHFGVTGEVDRCELLVTHNFVIGWFVSQVLQTPVWRWIGLNSVNCGLTIVKWESGQSPEVVAFNDTGHL